MLREFLPKFKLHDLKPGKKTETEYEDGRNELHKHQYINIYQVSKQDDNIRHQVSVASQGFSCIFLR